MVDLSPEGRKKLRTMCDAATAGPWEWLGDKILEGTEGDTGDGGWSVEVLLVTDDNKPYGLHSPVIEIEQRDKEFIAQARTALPDCLDRIEELDALIRKLARDVIDGNECIGTDPSAVEHARSLLEVK